MASMVFEQMKADILDRVTIEQMIEKYTPRTIKGDRCPCRLHNGVDNNMQIYRSTNSFYCYVCGKGGDRIRYVALYFGISDWQAMRKIDRDFNLGLMNHSSGSERAPAKLTDEQIVSMRRAELRKKLESYREKAATNWRYWVRLSVENKEIIAKASKSMIENSSFQKALRLDSYLDYRVDNAERIMRCFDR